MSNRPLPAFIITRILTAVLRYHILDSSQICRLTYNTMGSLKTVYGQLAWLTENGYLLRTYKPNANPFGRAVSLYSVATPGLHWLEALGYKVPERIRKSVVEDYKLGPIEHTLACNDTLIALELVRRRYPDMRVDSVIHEQELKRSPDYVTDAAGHKQSVVPDGWFEARVPDGNQFRQFAVSFEVDRGTEDRRDWQAKVAHILNWYKGPYQKRFGTDVLTVAVYATTGTNRFQDLLRWTEGALNLHKKNHGDDFSDMFLFTIVDPAAYPEEFYLGPYWVQPFTHRQVSLLEGLAQQAA